MPRGGKRPGAGRPKGSKDGVKLEREAKIAASGLTPLAFMLRILRDEDADPEDRKWAAQAAAPYVHPRLQQISAEVDQTVKQKPPYASDHNLAVLEKARRAGKA